MEQKPFKVVSWNVNSINSRIDRLLAFIDRHRPDVIMLQELKCADEKFPLEKLQLLSHNCAVYGQKTYNGVAVLSPHPISDVVTGFRTDDPDDDPAARLISAKINDVRVVNVYVPNGQSVASEKYLYKLDWLKKLRRHFDKNFSIDEPLVLGGDFNVAPDERDVYDPKAFENAILFSRPEREALQNVVSFGLIDTLRMHHSSAGIYSWWDYRMLAFPKNLGFRIDQIYATPTLAKTCTAAYIDRNERKGEKPSDHAPIISEFHV